MAIDFLDVLEELKAHMKEIEIWSFLSNTFITIEHEFIDVLKELKAHKKEIEIWSFLVIHLLPMGNLKMR